jgi:hypothetical protein
LAVRLLAGSLFAAGGVGVAVLFNAALGDAVWTLSTGLGACVAAAVYEVGRPERLSPERAQALEQQWQEFGALCGLGITPSNLSFDLYLVPAGASNSAV